MYEVDQSCFYQNARSHLRITHALPRSEDFHETYLNTCHAASQDGFASVDSLHWSLTDCEKGADPDHNCGRISYHGHSREKDAPDHDHNYVETMCRDQIRAVVFLYIDLVLDIVSCE